MDIVASLLVKKDIIFKQLKHKSSKASTFDENFTT